jgi:hypothetical protein
MKYKEPFEENYSESETKRLKEWTDYVKEFRRKYKIDK